MNRISLEEYAQKVGCDIPNASLQEIQDWAQENLDVTLWDYPKSELDYVIAEVTTNFVLVLVPIDGETRICELP